MTRTRRHTLYKQRNDDKLVIAQRDRRSRGNLLEISPLDVTVSPATSHGLLNPNPKTRPKPKTTTKTNPNPKTKNLCDSLLQPTLIWYVTDFLA
jgi:hypothetical protein